MVLHLFGNFQLTGLVFSYFFEKFKELPEGYYFIREFNEKVYVKKLEAPETQPSYVKNLKP